MMFKNVTQNEPAAAVNSTFWADRDVMTVVRQTADHVNGCFKAVCRSMQDHVISPRAICRHVFKVISPRTTSMNKVEQIRPIRLQEKETTRKKHKLSLLVPIMQFFMLGHGVGRLQANIVYPREWRRVCKGQKQALSEWDAASHKQRGSKFFLCPRLFVVYKVRIPHRCIR